jgi:hypothetical protein
MKNKMMRLRVQRYRVNKATTKEAGRAADAGGLSDAGGR